MGPDGNNVSKYIGIKMDIEMKICELIIVMKYIVVHQYDFLINLTS